MSLIEDVIEALGKNLGELAQPVLEAIGTHSNTVSRLETVAERIEAAVARFESMETMAVKGVEAVAGDASKGEIPAAVDAAVSAGEQVAEDISPQRAAEAAASVEHGTADSEQTPAEAARAAEAQAATDAQRAPEPAIEPAEPPAPSAAA